MQVALFDHVKYWKQTSETAHYCMTRVHSNESAGFVFTVRVTYIHLSQYINKKCFVTWKKTSKRVNGFLVVEWVES